jgi:hypothetical protein
MLSEAALLFKNAPITGLKDNLILETIII